MFHNSSPSLKLQICIIYYSSSLSCDASNGNLKHCIFQAEYTVFSSNLVCLQHFPITSVQYMTNSVFQFLYSNFMTFLDSLLSAIAHTCCINDQRLTVNHKSLVSTLPLSTIYHYFLEKHFLCLIILTTPLPFPSETILDRMVSVNVSNFLSQSLFPQR